MLHADRMTVPVLLVHVEDGYPVLVSHSRAMAKAPSQHKIRNEPVLIERATTSCGSRTCASRCSAHWRNSWP